MPGKKKTASKADKKSKGDGRKKHEASAPKDNEIDLENYEEVRPKG